MKKQYTVENVRELINQNIENNKYYMVDYNGHRVTYAMLVFLTIGSLIGEEKGCEDILKKIAEKNNMLDISEKNIIELDTINSLQNLKETIKRTSTEVYDDYVNLVKELYKVENTILTDCLAFVKSYREIACYSNYSGEDTTIPDDVAHLINYILCQDECNKIFYPDAGDVNICRAFSYTHYDKELTDLLQDPEIIQDAQKLQHLKNYLIDKDEKSISTMYVDSDTSIYGELDELPSVCDIYLIDKNKDTLVDAAISIFKPVFDENENTRHFKDFIDYCFRKGQVSKSAVIVIPNEWMSHDIYSTHGEIDFEEESLENIKGCMDRLFKEKRIKTIIELPDFCMGNKSYFMLVLNTNEEASGIKFINAKECGIIDIHGLCLDVNEVIKSLAPGLEENEIMDTYSYEYLNNELYLTLLYPHIWAPIIHNNKESRHLLSNLVQFYKYDRYEISNRSNIDYGFLPVKTEDIMSLYWTHDNYYDIIVNTRKNSYSKEMDTYRDADRSHKSYTVVKLEKESIIMESELINTIRFYNGNEPQYVSQGIAFHTNNELVTPEYLIYVMREMELPYDFIHHSSKVDIEYYKLFFTFPVVILDSIPTQVSFVENILKSEFDKRLKELSADQDRFSIRSAAADIQHMLGTPFSQQKVCMELIKRSKDVEVYKRNVAALIDISEYIQRIVTSVGADISKAEFNLVEIDLPVFLRQYIISYENYSTGYFKVESTLDSKSKGSVVVDVDMLKLQLDTILDNAGRHGFIKKSSADNIVQIQLDYIQYKDSPYYRISVMNNGKPKNPDYSVSDFISRGNFDGESGRTGLGGYHIHHIAHKHNGFVGIDSNDEWGFIVNILIPVQLPSGNKKIKYITDDKEYV